MQALASFYFSTFKSTQNILTCQLHGCLLAHLMHVCMPVENCVSFLQFLVRFFKIYFLEGHTLKFSYNESNSKA